MSSTEQEPPLPVKCPTCSAPKGEKCRTFGRVNGTLKEIKLEIRHSHPARFNRWQDKDAERTNADTE